jgi:hypothetical protein
MAMPTKSGGKVALAIASSGRAEKAFETTPQLLYIHDPQ